MEYRQLAKQFNPIRFDTATYRAKDGIKVDRQSAVYAAGEILGVEPGMQPQFLDGFHIRQV